jgi:hypothetical protein
MNLIKTIKHKVTMKKKILMMIKMNDNLVNIQYLKIVLFFLILEKKFLLFLFFSFKKSRCLNNT